MRAESLSPAEARRAALRAQGFDGGWPRRPGAALARLGLIQIDSVNVLQRAHYLPLFSRLGPYDRAALDRLATARPLRAFEYWGHEASLLPIDAHPLLRWRMAQPHPWRTPTAAARRNPALVADILAAVREHGPITAAALERLLDHPADRTQDFNWGWNWSDAKRVLEHLFWTGEVTAAGRDRGFARRYVLPERVLPAEILAAPTPREADAVRELVRRSARALGPATVRDLADYYRLRVAQVRPAIADLVAAGELVPVSIPGWPEAYFPAGTALPRRDPGTSALLVGFDPLIWNRDRTERLFGMRYRIEIYTPAAKRRFGYYVLPYLWGGDLVARLDLKADRAGGVLRVQAAWREPGHDGFEGDLSASLAGLAEWLGLGGVAVGERGDLADRLR